MRSFKILTQGWAACAGGESLDSAQKAQRALDNAQRQRAFMEQLQRKVQQRKGQADTVSSSTPCLAALLASAAKKVCPPMLTLPVMAISPRALTSFHKSCRILQDLKAREGVFGFQSTISTKRGSL